MAKFCLRPEFVQKFKKGLIEGVKNNGELHPDKLAKLSSKERRDLLAKYVGKENASQVNGLFESKLLLKNQKAGYMAWAKKVGGLSKEAKRDLISRIERMDKVLNPTEEKAFLEDLAATKLGFGVSETEAKTIFNLSKKVSDTKTKWEAKWGNKDWKKDNSWRNDADRLEWGAAQIELGNFVNNLKEIATKQGLKSYLGTKAIVELGGIAKTTKATLDVSGLFRQGWKTIWTNPLIWQKNARNMFANYARTLRDGQKVLDSINADIISRPYYDEMVKGKLAISTIEEAFPTRLPQKIPVLGRVIEASDTAFTGFAYRQRADIFEATLKIAEKSGVNLNDVNELQSIAKMVNALTGRGNIGGLEPSAKTINNIFFAPRFVASQVQLFTQPLTGAGGSAFVRKQATKNLIKVVTGTAGVLMIARSVLPDSVETNPTSSNFGQIKVGNTRFDVTGGHRTVITLTSRIFAAMTGGKIKSATTGIESTLNSGEFGATTGTDLVVDYAQNKLSPIGSVIKDLLNQRDFHGNKLTVAGELNNLITPLPIVTYFELKNDPNSAPILLAMMAESAGIGTNTYGKSQKNWENSTGKELTQFKEKVGEEKFKEANEKYNKKYDEWFQDKARKPEYQKLSDEDKESLLNSAKEKIKQDVFKEYRFKYKQDRKSKTDKARIKKLLP